MDTSGSAESAFSAGPDHFSGATGQVREGRGNLRIARISCITMGQKLLRPELVEQQGEACSGFGQLLPDNWRSHILVPLFQPLVQL